VSTLVDPDLHREIARFGGKDVDLCMNCGNCTAVCPLSVDGDTSFPRRVIHYLQLGRADKLMETADPWLCYYCGECTESCPRDANPAETMMATRRYLTSQYDWTGLARLFYRSPAAELIAVGLVAVFVAALFLFLHGPVITDRVALNTFAPVGWVHFGDLTMAALLLFFLLTNGFRMYRGMMLRDGVSRIPLLVYIRQIPTFLIHFFTQKRSRDCDSEHSRTRWITHLILVSGYLIMLTLVLGLLMWFQTDEVYPFYHPQRLLGYYATAALLYGTVVFMVGRLKKVDPAGSFSEASDWMFLILLFLTALSGIVMHGLRVTGFPMATYVAYVVHLAIAVPMLVVEVPFGKWSHLLYRPLALYLVSVRDASTRVVEEEVRVPVAV